MIYFIKDEKRNGTNFKVGFAKDIDQRMSNYYTHNSDVELLEFMVTYKKTKHQLETAIHAEMKEMGIEFLTAEDGRTTEWFFIDANHEKEFEEKGLAQFKACKGRKIYKAKG